MRSVFKFLPLHCLAIAALTIAPVFMPEQWVAWLSYNREAILAGEWWRLWSGHFVHFTMMHAWVNGILLLLLSLTLDKVFSRKLVLGLLVVGPVAVSVLLALLVPEMVMYRGASALASLFMTILICHAFGRIKGRSAYVLYIMVFGWLIKLILESAGVSLSELPQPIRVAWQAHIAGIMIGAAAYYGLKQYLPRHGYLASKILVAE